MNDEYALMWVPVITVEKVEQAKRILQLPDVCSRTEIRSAYLRLAKQWHPDICTESNDECVKQFRQISNGWNFMKYLMEHYRYSLREADIKRYQESYEIKHQRRFGGGLWAGEVEDRSRLRDDFMNQSVQVTAENIAFARNLLELLELTEKERIKKQQRKMLKKYSADNNAVVRSQILNAGELLLALIKNYRYVLTPEAIRRDQESSLAWHRRQFDSEPLWSGGIFDDAFHNNLKHNSKGRFDGKFQGIC
ncbi:MAG: DnaJ domain-containing protein [Victivallaceae bacterium]|nr:DnaJ domain-containing protein [Victivallaceae bacterium]